MSESIWQKIKRFLIPRRGFLIPWRVNTAVAVWWEWGGQTLRLQRHDGREHPPPSPFDDRKSSDG